GFAYRLYDLLVLLFFSTCSLRPPLSFPTRRSSDLRHNPLFEAVEQVFTGLNQKRAEVSERVFNPTRDALDVFEGITEPFFHGVVSPAEPLCEFSGELGEAPGR